MSEALLKSKYTESVSPWESAEWGRDVNVRIEFVLRGVVFTEATGRGVSCH
jgi:hypothetical protein